MAGQTLVCWIQTTWFNRNLSKTCACQEKQEMTLDFTNDPALCDFTPIARTESLADKVQDALVELIIARVLKPGQHIVETDIAQQLGVSRQPVREALRSLHVHGWVDQRQGRGTFVHQPSEKEMSDILRVRVLLECEAARLAAESATVDPTGVRNLQRIIEDGRDAFEANDMRAALALDEKLHEQIAHLADNDYLSDTLEKLGRRARWYLQPLVEQRGIESWNEHSRIVDAIAASDGALAASLMQAHTDSSLKLAFAEKTPATA
jgi:DNA-binding GntR family transcriptional regulator